MTISNMNDPSTITGAPVRGSDGEKLGKVDAIYYDDATDAPEWAAVKSGLFGGHVSLVPLAQASWDGDALTVPFDKAALKAAPHHDPDAAISATDEDELYRHYGLTGGQTTTDGRRDIVDEPGTVGRDTSGPTTDEAMTRSEEKLRVGTETARPAGPGCASTWSPSTSRSRCRSRAKRSPSSASRSPRPTAATPTTVRPSPRRSTRSRCTPSAPWSASRPSPSSGSSSATRPSPSRRRWAARSARSRSSSTAPAGTDADADRNRS